MLGWYPLYPQLIDKEAETQRNGIARGHAANGRPELQTWSDSKGSRLQGLYEGRYFSLHTQPALQTLCTFSYSHVLNSEATTTRCKEKAAIACLDSTPIPIPDPLSHPPAFWVSFCDVNSSGHTHLGFPCLFPRLSIPPLPICSTPSHHRFPAGGSNCFHLFHHLRDTRYNDELGFGHLPCIHP